MRTPLALVVLMFGALVTAIPAENVDPPKRLVPTEYLDLLKTELKTRGAYTPGIDGPVPAEVAAGDLAALVKLLDSKEPCAATIKAGLARLPAGSTVGHEAGVLLDSYRLDAPYPIGESSTDHVVDKDAIKGWYKERKTGFDIRLGDGSIAISSDTIIAYDLASHKMTLRRGTVDVLRKAIHGKGAKLFVPFTASVGGKPVYEGQFVSPLSSRSSDTVSVVLDLAPRDGNVLHIARGYAIDETKLVEPDPRGDERIEKSLKAAGKAK